MNFKSTKIYIITSFVVLAALLALFFTSCSKKRPLPPDNIHIVQGADILQFLSYTNNINPVFSSIITDDNYSLPSRNWVLNSYSLSLKDLYNLVGGSKYIPAAWDCENFAKAAAFWMTVLHQNSPNRPPATGIAFGEFGYIKDNGEGHAINFFICIEDNKWKMYFYEPQTYQLIELSAEEKRNCLFVIL